MMSVPVDRDRAGFGGAFVGESVRAGRTGDQRAGRPFLRPIRKVVPLIANVDLSPLVLLLLLQIVLMALGGFQGAFLPLDDRLIAAWTNGCSKGPTGRGC